MVVLNRDYATWPEDPEARRQMARAIWGRDLVSAYDGWLKSVRRMLLEGERRKRPPHEVREVETWVTGLTPEQRQGALLFAKYAAHRVIFDILTALDNCTAGSWVAPAISEYRLVLNVYASEEVFLSRRPTESMELQSEGDLDFHEEWFDWLDRYSEFGSIADHQE